LISVFKRRYKRI